MNEEEAKKLVDQLLKAGFKAETLAESDKTNDFNVIVLGTGIFYTPEGFLKNETYVSEILRIASEEHMEYIGEFSKDYKICLDGFFVIDEIEAILLKMKEVECKQSH